MPKRNKTYFYDLVRLAEKEGRDGPAFAAALETPECHSVVMAKLENQVDGARSTMDCNDVFLWHLAKACDFWTPLLTEADFSEIANQLPGTRVLKGRGGNRWRDGVKFQDLPWWPTA
ncbi:hypothetical protein [uncultured Shimia sp.]|uniref:hypothetical protein n=1 Tax=uncultured Shimia sp. TaxID=573152 RepID=UPI002629D612|nr:hypothetical protein [uncultured Shimia sp.]